MRDWQKAVVRPEASIREVLQRLDSSGSQITLVVDEDGRLAGTITDGDVRRGILRGIELDSPASLVMNQHPTTANVSEESDRIVSLMRNRHLRQIPIVDAAGHIVGLRTIDELTIAPERENPVVIMAGGLGTRLMPLTANVPKPMIPVGGRPILEHALIALAEQGFRRFYFTINYLGEMVEEHFQGGERWGVQIEYVREPQRMGTAGALSLLPEPPTRPLLVMNGDIITKLNFNHLMQAHAERGAAATVGVRNYDYQVPFGVTRIEGDRLVAIEEKPTVRHFVSAGIYVVSPHALDQIPADSFFDMPQLLNKLLMHGEPVHVFPITEYWLDVGRHDELQRAMLDFQAEPQ